MGKNVILVDSGKAVAEELKNLLSSSKMLNEGKTKGKKEFYVTDLTDRFTKVAEMFLGQKIKNKLAKIDL
jgi:glutamate racemase